MLGATLLLSSIQSIVRHAETDMLRSIQMLIALHRSERQAFAEWIGIELDFAFDKTVKS